jgi:hypothetical protein
MEERPWIPLESDGKWAGGFCHLLRECLETAGVETYRVCYKGRTMGPLGQSSTFLIVTVQVDPQVPEFKGVKVHYFESSTMEVHQVCAHRALKEVCVQLGEKLKDTPFSILPMTVYDPSRWDTYDHTQYFEVTTEVEDKKLHMANRCILAQDQELYWADSEITFLRWKWDRTLQLAQELELEKLDLADRLEESHQRNSELVQLGLAATRASIERDGVKIATLEARLKTAEEKHRATVEATRADRERLAEAKYLMESIGAAAADYQERVWDLEERSRHNYNHLCYLGGGVYEEQDRATRTRTAWERSDQRRLAELEEISAQLLPKKMSRLRVETFELPLTLLPQLRLYPRGSQDTTEMDCALQDIRDNYGGPVIRLSGYPGVSSPSFYAVPPDSSPEAPQCTP